MAEFNQSLQHNLSQRQEQQLSPQQYQALELLAAPLMELQERIDQELSANPVLEVEANPIELLSGDPVGGATEAELRPEGEENKIDRDDDFAELAELAEHWNDLRLPGDGDGNPEEARRQEHFFNSLTDDDGSMESLPQQLRWIDAPPEVIAAAKAIIDELDERAYLNCDIDELARAHGADPELFRRALDLVQSLEPAGVGARSLAECLTLQLERKGESDDLLYALIEEHLDAIAHNRLPQVAKAMDLTLPELQERLEKLKGLQSAPGRELYDTPPAFVAPELAVEVLPSGEMHITGHDRWLPRLRISQEYLDMYNDPTTPEETRSYLREKIMKARELFGSLEFRQSTLRKITEALTVLQPEFFEQGPEKLKPMTMRQVADRIGVHETTVSRAVAGKYLRTPSGIFEFRKFFSGGYRSDSGEEVASVRIHQLIRDLVDAENPAKPLSDDAIAQELQKQGYPVARRTVAKYRGILGILPTNLRRRHQ